MKIATVPIDRLRAELENVTSAKAAKRLMIAIAYKDGVAVSTLSERYEIPRSTVYSWLDRFEELPIEEAVRDEERPGRPPALTADERSALETDLADSPRAFGFTSPAWSPELVRDHVAEKYGVEYSVGHVRRILRTLRTDYERESDGT